MSDFTITTTADFDAGTKSQDTNNYQIETDTDNPANTAGQIVLGNMKGDAFNLADADAINWKWIDSPNYVRAGDITLNIDTGVNDAYYARLNRVGGVDAKGGSAITQKLTGDFDIRINIDLTTWPLDSSCLFRFTYWADATHYFLINRVASGGVDYLQTARSNGASYTTAHIDLSMSMRIVRIGNLFFSYYDNAGGDSWTSHAVNLSVPMGDGYIVLEHWRYNTNELSIGYWSNFEITSGDFAAGGYHASGNWESAVQTMAFAGKLLNTTITHSGLSGTFYIDKIEWLVGGVVQATYDTNITTGASTTIEEGDLTGGTFDDVDADFTVKVYLAGDGTDTPVVTEIEGDYEMINPVAGGGSEVSPTGVPASILGSGL